MTAAKKPLLLLDWDGTLTPVSTLEHIAAIRPGTSSDILKPYTEAYMNDYSEHARSYRPRAVERKTLKDEIDYLNSLRPVEAVSVQRLEQGLIWQNVTNADIDEASQRAALPTRYGLSPASLRNGTKVMIESVWTLGGLVGVVSVGWSGRWIAGVLRAHGISALSATDLPDWKANLNDRNKEQVIVFANEIDPNGTGKLSRSPQTGACIWNHAAGDTTLDGVWVADHKARIVHDVVESIQRAREEWRTVYIGDSPTDLGCLAEADFGVCVRSEPLSTEQKALKEVTERLNIRCEIPSRSDYMKGTGECSKEGQLWWIHEFSDINDKWFS